MKIILKRTYTLVGTVNTGRYSVGDVIGIALVSVFTTNWTLTSTFISMITFTLVTAISITTLAIRVAIVRVLEAFIDIETLYTITFVSNFTFTAKTTKGRVSTALMVNG